jgi:hypothetical protein
MVCVCLCVCGETTKNKADLKKSMLLGAYGVHEVSDIWISPSPEHYISNIWLV